MKISLIEGYQNKPLVALEEAIDPLTPILPEVKHMVWIAKEKCSNPRDGLTRDESAAIVLYTMEGESQEQCVYAVLNQTIRLEDRRKLIPWFPYLKLLLTALYKLPSFIGVVWRGVRSDLSKQYRKNEIFVWWGFSSCTSNVSILETDQFLGKHGTRTILSIQCSNAKRIGNHSYFSSEEEVLLLPGFHGRVLNTIELGNGLRMINIQEIESPYPLVPPPF